jgi:hypothetical protein
MPRQSDHDGEVACLGNVLARAIQWIHNLRLAHSAITQ